VGDLLLPTENQLIAAEETSENGEEPGEARLGLQHAVVLIHVKVKVNRATENNTDFL
jgi:hypothetical protein